MPEVPVCDREKKQDFAFYDSGCMPHRQEDFCRGQIKEIDEYILVVVVRNALGK